MGSEAFIFEIMRHIQVYKYPYNRLFLKLNLPFLLDAQLAYGYLHKIKRWRKTDTNHGMG